MAARSQARLRGVLGGLVTGAAFVATHHQRGAYATSCASDSSDSSGGAAERGRAGGTDGVAAAP